MIEGWMMMLEQYGMDIVHRHRLRMLKPADSAKRAVNTFDERHIHHNSELRFCFWPSFTQEQNLSLFLYPKKKQTRHQDAEAIHQVPIKARPNDTAVGSHP